MVNNEEINDCESCGEPTDRIERWQVAPGEWENFHECPECAEEARLWNEQEMEREFLSPEEFEAIQREEDEAIAWEEFAKVSG
jgi:hypothetical protein